MPVQELVSVGWASFNIVRCKVPVWACRCRIVISSGRELMRV